MKTIKRVNSFLLCVIIAIGFFGSCFHAAANADATIYCSECGKKIAAVSKFCMFCGHKIEAPLQQASNSEKLKTPIIRSIVLNENNKPEITWDAVDGVEYYSIYRSEDTMSYTNLNINTKDTKYTIKSCKDGKTYYFKIKAKFMDGSYSEFSPVESIIIPHVPSQKNSSTPTATAPANVSVSPVDEVQSAIVDYRTIAASFPMKNISCSGGHAVAIRQDGSVVADGNNQSDQCKVSEWRNVVVVEAGDNCTFGIMEDGYAVVVGKNNFGQFDRRWEYLTDISVNSNHVVGLREDGTVVALGSNEYGECNTGSWDNIIAISAGGRHTVGLRADGTVAAVGDNTDGQCNVNDWRNIIAISAGGLHTVGLTADGRVFATGSKINGACNVQNWSNIVAIDAGNTHTVGIKADGTAIATGTTLMGECNVSAWTDLVAINAGGSMTLGLRKDGRILYTSSLFDIPWYGIKTAKDVPNISARTGDIPGDQNSSGITWNYDDDTKTLVFFGSGSMRDYTIEEGITLPWTTYQNVTELVDIKDGITSIGNCAFLGMASFTGQGINKIFIPKTVKRIGEAAFEFSFDLSDVYYEGAREEWQQINIEKNNDFLMEALLHYNSKEEDLF